MSVPKNVRPARLYNSRYFRRVKQRVDAHRMMAMVQEHKRKIIAGLVGVGVALVALGAGAASVVRWWLR